MPQKPARGRIILKPRSCPIEAECVGHRIEIGQGGRALRLDMQVMQRNIEIGPPV